MTIHPFQTARYNATPMARHVTQKQAQPVYTSLDAMIKDMKADARQIRERHSGMKERDTTGEVAEEAILDAIRQNPGIDIAELARMVNRSASNIRTRMSSMENRGQVITEKFKHPKSFRWTRRFFPVDNPKLAKTGRPAKPSPRRDEVMSFLRANTGCTSGDLAKHMGCSVRAAGAHISEVRKVAKVRMERQAGGQHLPGRYWIEDDTNNQLTKETK